MAKRALITGITGQDGSYLSEYLLSLGYSVYGIVRRHSVAENQSSRLMHINDRITRLYGDLNDEWSISKIINEVQPDEIYNLGAQSHLAVSFESPEYTADVDAIGTLRILEAIRILGLEKKQGFIRHPHLSFMD